MKKMDVSEAGGARLDDSVPLEIPEKTADVVPLRRDEPRVTDGGNGSMDPGEQVEQVERPTYVYQKGNLHLAVDFALPELGKVSSIYQRTQQLVHVVPAEGGTDKRGVDREAGSPIIADLPSALLRQQQAESIDWRRYDRREKKDLPCDPPPFVVEALYARGYWPDVRVLRGITGAPVLRPDGSICSTPGYDAETGLLYEPSGPVPAIPEEPTLDDARRAAGELLEVVTDFPFVDDAHRAAWLASVLSPIAWPAFEDGAPLFAFDANSPAAGKGLLVHAAALIATGRRMPASPFVEKDNEMRKSITARVLSGDSTALIDNIPTGGPLGWPSLDAALTADTWSDRILGKSEIVRLPLNIVWFATGNNLIVRHDAARRVLKIRIEVQEEHPEERSGFDHEPLLPWVRTHRLRLLTAALTILRAYFVAGKPSQKLTPIGSFEGWSDLVRSAIVWLDMDKLGDPVDCLASRDPDADPMAGAHLDLMTGWRELEDPGSNGLTCAQALRQIAHDTEKHDATIAALAELIDVEGLLPPAQKLGALLRGFKGRWRATDGHNLAFVGRRERGVTRWSVSIR